MNALELEHVYFERGLFVLADLNFELKTGETVAISGRSGSGKTTLFELIGNVIRPAGGYIRFFGKEMYEAEAEIRKLVSFIFAEPNFNCERRIDHMVKEWKRLEPALDLDAFWEYLEYFGIIETKRIRVLSKGQRKKLMLALALSRKPKLLLMDEPTSGLDERSRQEFFQIIEDYRKKHELTVLFSTHHEDDITTYADRMLTIENGGVR